MTLPTSSTPTYPLTIPSTGQHIKVRPFVVRDEKALLIAHETKRPEVMLDTVKEVVKSCSLNKVDVESLASFDIEYLFLQLRSISVGEIVEMLFRCDVCPPENEKAVALVGINLEDAKVEKFEGHINPIPLFDNVGVKMKYPTIEVLKQIETADDNNPDELIDLILSCIDYVYDDEEMFPIKEQSRKDAVDFIENLTAAQFEKIRNFFRTMPQMRLYVNYTCPVCNTQHNKYLEGLTSFF